MIKPAPCFTRASMIDCYHVAISHASDSLQVVRVFHEVITFTTCEAHLGGVHGGMRLCGVGREPRVVLLESVRSTYRTVLVSRAARAEASLRRAERPRAMCGHGLGHNPVFES